MAEVFCESVRTQDGMDGVGSGDDSCAARIHRTLHLAGAMAGILVAPMVYGEDLAALSKTAEKFGLGADVFSAAFDAAKEEWRNLGDVLSVRTHEAPSMKDAHTRASRLLSTLSALKSNRSS